MKIDNFKAFNIGVWRYRQDVVSIIQLYELLKCIEILRG